MKELRLGSITLDNPFFLAPLAGITDASMRKICKEMGAALVFSEMVSASSSCVFRNGKRKRHVVWR